MSKISTTTAIGAFAISAACIIQTFNNPEQPNLLGKAFFSAIIPHDNAYKMSAYAEFLHAKYQTDLLEEVPTTLKHYYLVSPNKNSRIEIFDALIKGPVTPIEPYIEEALIANYSSTSCNGPVPSTVPALIQCRDTLVRLGIK